MRPNPGVRAGSGAAFAFIRRLERSFSPLGLHRVLAPWIGARVALKRSRPFLPLPPCLGGGNFQISKLQQRKNYLNTALEFFPEQLGTPKWRERLTITGAEHLEAARGRPVILAFCHFGPYFLMRYWLRAAGFPAATLVEGKSQNRLWMKQLKDRVSPFPKIPIAFHTEDQLRETIEFLNTGHPLLIAIDVIRGKQVDVPIDDHWQFGMANGAIRLAMRHSAELIPCSIIDRGSWQFEIRLSPPIPASMLASGDPLLAGKSVLDALVQVLREHPEQCTERLVKQFQRANLKSNPDEPIRPRQAIAR
jgi:lauroyl/myristoyl acyltransferase